MRCFQIVISPHPSPFGATFPAGEGFFIHYVLQILIVSPAYFISFIFLILYKLTLEDTAIVTGNIYLGEVTLNHFLTAEDISHVDLVTRAHGVTNVVCDTGKNSVLLVSINKKESEAAIGKMLAEYKSVVTRHGECGTALNGAVVTVPYGPRELILYLFIHRQGLGIGLLSDEHVFST